MATKTKKKNGKAKAPKEEAAQAGPSQSDTPETAGCQACNFTGEVCRKCGEPIVQCDCETFEPVACGKCGTSPAEIQPEPPEAAAVGDVQATEQPPAGYETADQPPAADDADEAGLAAEEAAAFPTGEPRAASGGEHHGQKQPDDPELEAMAKASVARRIKRFKEGTRRRHHTKQLTYRVLTGIIKAGQAAAEGGAEGFFGRWTRGDLMAWEALMDAAEWAQEEVNRREFLRMKREAAKSTAEEQKEAAAKPATNGSD